jgi:hypothetical protein
MSFVKRNWFWLALICVGVFLFLRAQKTVAAAEKYAGESAGIVAGGTMGAALSTLPGGALLANIFTSLF